MLTVIAPMEREISYLRRDSGLRRWEGVAIQVLAVGIGKEALQSSLSRWLKARENGPESTSADRLLLLGFGGAVDPSLACGDLVLSRRYHLEPDSPEETCKKFFESDYRMTDFATTVAEGAGLSCREAESLTVGHLVANQEEKSAIRRSHQVGVVNMEDYWVAEVAARAKIPFLAVRAILDTAGQEIPAHVMELQAWRWHALGWAAARPWQIPKLVNLAGNLRVAQESLRRFATAFLQNLESLENWQLARTG